MFLDLAKDFTCEIQEFIILYIVIKTLKNDKNDRKRW
jgi:hypothetical protein